MTRLPLLALLALTACFTNKIEEGRDRDGDGFVNWELGGEDCDDDDALVNPSADEACADGVDNNCDGLVDDTSPAAPEWYLDEDGDGFFGSDFVQLCDGPDNATTEPGTFDCDDSNSNANPGLSEQCGDGVDNNCNDIVDSDADDNVTYYVDADDDGFADPTPQSGCTAPVGSFSNLSNGEDCDDGDQAVNPVAEERCGDAIDNNCDDAIDDAGLNDVPWYEDADNDGFPGATENRACDVPLGGFATLLGGIDCNDLNAAINPAADEIYYDGVDQDCAGGDDYDADLDGVSSDEHGGDDCDDTNPSVRPGVTEVCNNGLDDDCSGDAPECEWPVSGDIDEVATTILTGLLDGLAGAALWVGDGNGDGVSDLVLAGGQDDVAQINGPLLAGIRSVHSEIDHQVGDSLVGFVNAINVIDGPLGKEVAVTSVGDGPVFLRPLPPSTQGVSNVTLAAPANSALGRFIGTGTGIGTGLTLGTVVLQGPKRSDVVGGWDGGLHVWPSGRPSFQTPTSFNIAPMSLPAGDADWDEANVLDVNADGRADVIVGGILTDGTAGIISIQRAPLVDGQSLDGGPTIVTDPFETWAFNLTTRMDYQLAALDSDAEMEIVVAAYDGARVLDLPTAAQVSALSGTLRLVPSQPTDTTAVLPVGDYNGNGLSDVVVLSRSGEDHWLDVFFDVDAESSVSPLADRTYALEAPALSTTPTAPRGSGVGDVNGDGVADLVLYQRGTIYVLAGVGR